MAKKKKEQRLLDVQTPYTAAPTVTIFASVWEKHVVPSHPELFGRIEDVQRTLESPTAICAATNPTTNLAFVNHNVTINGDPLVAYVNPNHGLGPNSLSTAYPDERYADLSKVTVLWKP